MEIERSIRHANNWIIAGMAVVFAGLVLLIGIASNDVPGDVEPVQPTFDVAPATSMLPTPPDTPNEPRSVPPSSGVEHRLVAHQQPKPSTHPATPPTDVRSEPVARTAPVERKMETWFPDESAAGRQPDAPR